MSDFNKDDPWAKWRKPGAAVDAGSPAEKPAERPAARSRPAPEAKAETPRVPPTGTLTVNRSPVVRTPSRGPVKKAPAAQSTAKIAPVKDVPVKAPRPELPPGEAPTGVRLSKVMSERGMCSRREADLWIERGWVFVNGQQISELGSRIGPDAEIAISKEAKADQAKQVTILINKPVGYVSGQPEPGSTPAVTLISLETQLVQSGDPEFKPWMLRGLAPAGRLDIDSTGLLVLTQDGRVAKKLIGDESTVEKEYLVRISGELIPNGLALLNHGLELDDKPLRPARVKQLNEDQLHFILKEGKKRQIRRMCELVGLRVIGLKRVRIGRVRLGDLEQGQWRFLRADEAF